MLLDYDEHRFNFVFVALASYVLIMGSAVALYWFFFWRTPSKQIEGLIFDLDGTLLDYEGISHRALEAPLSRRDKSLSWELHGQIVGKKAEDWSRIILDELGVSEKTLTPEDYVKEYFEELEDLYNSLKPFANTVKLLHSLNDRGFPMAIATSSPRDSFDKKMKRHPEIMQVMKAVVTGDEVECGKPSADIFLEAARRIGCDPKRCIVFEDSPSGILGGQRAGCYVAALPDPRFRANEKKIEGLKPTWILYDGIASFSSVCLNSITKVAPRKPEARSCRVKKEEKSE